ncbi:hypothetical protein EUX98_g4323 [Antrodiella citrinella]|uniref:RanBD1 domain-containing protein n=1 Tax=Antrodiella citrinella TaxID=2447956 RepID=A0A4S4MUD5_9APHY|nr:hypothetical protein EUX98_g4323 [Antrodiella citrinella]
MDEDEDEDAEVKNATAYFMALRGLNNSFLSAVAEAIKTDAFVDLTSYLAHYKSLREAEIKKYEEAKVSAKKNGSSSFTAPAAPAAAAKPAPSMPAPPTTFSGFAGFGAPSASSSSINSSSGGGFSFKPGAASSGGSSPFSFPSSSTPAERTEAPKSTFSFGAPSSSSSTSASNPFGVSSSSTPSVFGSNLFGGASFTSAKPEADKSTTNGSASNTFGPSSSAFSTPATSLSNGTGSLFGASSATATSSSGSSNLAPSFGTSDSTNSANPLFAGFGKPPAAKIGNPVGFGFGNPSSSPSVNPFTFGSSSSSSQPANPLESKVKEESGSESQESTSAPVADGGHPPLLRTSSQHDVEGEGEEQEDTEHAVRSKVFRLTKQSDGTQNWSDLGVGMLRVKTHKTSGARRLLLRNSSTGKILINFNIYTGMTPSVAKNTVSFVGHDNSDPAAPGTAVPFKLRVKTDDEAHQLKGALDRAIEFVKSKSD